MILRHLLSLNSGQTVRQTYGYYNRFLQGGRWVEKLGRRRSASETPSRIRALSFVRRLRLSVGASNLDHEKSKGA